MPKPELLLPAGSPEALMAALEGGADAVYLGLQSFNARNRAKNFSINELPDVLSLANKYHAKVYVTLNTLLKNNELPKLIRLLSILQKLPISAVIIQDWGLYWLIRNYFPKIQMHTSTQMGNHNSVDCSFAQERGFGRVILAREVTLVELGLIRKNSSIDLEMFAHGALCYSYSGYCLFSSWVGGNSANRGACRQPCRQIFQTTNGNDRPFCMKDLQLIDHLPQIVQAGISSIKIEGRMRSAEYVFNVARAYRSALDNFNNIPAATDILSEDGGRSKTAWRFVTTTDPVIIDMAQTGTELGYIKRVTPQYLYLQLRKSLNENHTIQIMLEDSASPLVFKIGKLYTETTTGVERVTTAESDTTVLIENPGTDIPLGSKVVRLARGMVQQFKWSPSSTKLPGVNPKQEDTIQRDIYQALSKHVGKASPQSRQQSIAKTTIYIRIQDPKWISHLKNIPNLRIICPLQCADSISRPNLIPEIPLYIAETELDGIRRQISSLLKKGFQEFSLSRLSQVQFFKSHKQVRLLANENIYCLNDATIIVLREINIRQHIAPIENDFPNLISSKDRSAIIPMYFHPHLFVSKQAPTIQPGDSLKFENKPLRLSYTDNTYQLSPQDPVCLFNFHKRLLDKGFTKFLIDLSNHLPDPDLLNDIVQNFQLSNKLPNTSGFNFKKGLH
ncbi:MAG: hypothetical protein CVU48_09765 [Candidatus Cloacimonetes bacterium HGW-Cloacimonetes-1]|jgi:putative protease|nr:MAG: hypothetical protein CVU48_09765 [Candidatus Cloacimonetes bacterium HGW-Cloacimonetes-1]